MKHRPRRVFPMGYGLWRGWFYPLIEITPAGQWTLKLELANDLCGMDMALLWCGEGVWKLYWSWGGSTLGPVRA